MLFILNNLVVIVYDVGSQNTKTNKIYTTGALTFMQQQAIVRLNTNLHL